jgi:replication fork protection complex subunit Tof1/Swi1
VKEAEQYKSLQFIEDSDAEYGDMDTFLEKEKERRLRAQEAAASAEGGSRPTNMKATGTKKRRRKGERPSASAKRQKNELPAEDAPDVVGTDASESDDTPDDSDAARSISGKPAETQAEGRKRPKPRPITQNSKAATSVIDDDEDQVEENGSPSPTSLAAPRPKPAGRRQNLLVLSDEDE